MSLPLKPKKIQSVYLDHAATTPLDPAVFRAMKPWLEKNHANPSALYAQAVAARNAIEAARKSVAEILFTQPDTIVFTGSGTESTNLAILGVAHHLPRLGKEGRLAPKAGGVVDPWEGSQTTSSSTASTTPARLGFGLGEAPSFPRRGKFRGHIITTQIEHHAVLHPIQHLEKQGWKVTYLIENKEGLISIEDFKKSLRPETVLVSIMYANNEVGSIQPIGDIGREILKWRKTHSTPYPYFHTDACQAAAYLDLHVDRLHVDLMSLNGSKIYGPKGTGVLYKRRGIELEPIMYGGGQEFGMRSGTENVAGIVGFAKALELISKYRDKEISRVEKLRDYFWKRIHEEIPDIMQNGPLVNHPGDLSGRPPLLLKEGTGGGQLKRQQKKLSPPLEGGAHGEAGGVVGRLPNNLHITFHNVDAEALILYLDEYGIQCSSGSACTTDSDEVSHVLLACGLLEEQAKSSIRFTLGKETSKKDINYVMEYLPKIVEELRKTKLPSPASMTN